MPELHAIAECGTEFYHVWVSLLQRTAISLLVKWTYPVKYFNHFYSQN
ncbi:hypothetical protein [Dapis sp. BLCC M229]